MSVRERCLAYSSSSSGYWKHSLSDIISALKTEDHPDHQIFSTVACTLMMNDRPGYWHWLENAIAKLIDDPKSRLDPLPDLPEYEEMSNKELLDKYEVGDENYPRTDILGELKYRYPLLIQSDEIESIIDLRNKLKDVI
ncbi:unnamed protein product [Rotaria sp. Silwood1]|nr:unnamed protein product [Rotaria sp. Silwood1]CAF3396086.1 unnamed protein product [Rotaria sp. Silwood1]CAF3396769.1 unnamed protein product [Rotaria sp. Silwood1]CAF4504931.1 unnamed protein product [Rotaria sp. Silwood1]CAF4552570.1 unnamed protein product [Rotaria sp. Silwood1]